MPWKVKKVGDQYNVVKSGTGKKVASHSDPVAARNQVKALYASLHGNRVKKGSQPSYAKAASRRMQRRRAGGGDEHDYK